jgi:hypothetical protein
MKSFTLPISPDYVSHWGLWEAIREIEQNAIDEKIRNPQCEISTTYNDGLLQISTNTGHLSPDTLLLGSTNKKDNNKLIGKFGEGYKLALLVFTRLGLDVEILNGDKKWIPKIEYDEEFGAEVLKIYVTDQEIPTEGVQFVILGISQEQWKEIQRNIIPFNGKNEILDGADYMWRIYVGGLFVTVDKTLKKGYSFTPSTLSLDRDRGMVNSFDLQWNTSELWSQRSETAEVDELIEEEAPDVKYVENHTTPTHHFAVRYTSRYIERHGEDVVPVATQEEVERATSAGMKWKLVPKSVKSLLGMVKRWFVPTSTPPVVRLERFLKRYQYSLDQDAREELQDIINALQPKTQDLVEA